MRHLAWLLGLACTAAACSSREVPFVATPGGTLVIATSGDADHLLPPLVVTIVGKQVSDALYLPIARIGDQLNILGDEGFTGVLADRWEWSPDSLSITFHIDPTARWHDGAPVRSDDVTFSFGIYRHPAVGSDHASAMASIAEVRATDSLTFVVSWPRRSATQFYDFAYTFYPFPRHIFQRIAAESLRTSPQARAPIGSGKFRFSVWEPGVRLEVVADTTHWLGRPSLDRVIWSTVPAPATQVAQLLAGDADLVEILRPPFLEQATADSSLRFVQRGALDFGVATFNLREPRVANRPHPLFGDPALRQALTLGLDRAALVRAVLDTLGVAMTSPYLSALGIPGFEAPVANAERARVLLDSIGFTDPDGDGIRARGSTPLAFALTVPGTSTTRTRLATLMKDAWAQVGARVTIRTTDAATQVAEAEAGDFDATLLGFTGDPSPAFLRQQWSAKGGANWGGYSNQSFDALMDSAAIATNPRTARELYASAGRVLTRDAPSIWLYELRSVTGMHRRIRPAFMRTDAWWAHLDEWSVDPADLKPRDRMGAAPGQQRR